MQVRTPPLPRKQVEQRVKGKSPSSPTRAKLSQSPNTTHTAASNRKRLTVHIVKSGIARAFSAKYVSYGWKPRGTTVRVCQRLCGRHGNWISFVQHFVFPRRQKRQKNEGRAPLQKRHGLFGEMGVWCEQTMINTVPSPQTPIFLDVILGADNRPALYRFHTCAWVRNRAGWEGAAVVFSQCVWVAMIHKHRGFFLSSSHLPHSAVGGGHTARPGGSSIEKPQTIIFHHVCVNVCLNRGFDGSL